jgi:hypothetical protein
MGISGFADDPFPLTPALSLREREQSIPRYEVEKR